MSVATRSDIARWLAIGKHKGATHVIIATDGFDMSDYPCYVAPGESVRAEIARVRSGEMRRVTEVYDLSLDLEAQLGEYRAYHDEEAFPDVCQHP